MLRQISERVGTMAGKIGRNNNPVKDNPVKGNILPESVGNLFRTSKHQEQVGKKLDFYGPCDCCGGAS